jgi:hypothetical protein
MNVYDSQSSTHQSIYWSGGQTAEALSTPGRRAGWLAVGAGTRRPLPATQLPIMAWIAGYDIVGNPVTGFALPVILLLAKMKISSSTYDCYINT